MAVIMLVSVAHQLITLYFISDIGAHAIAGVSTAGNVGYIVSALGQVLNVGISALVAQSAGRKDFRDISVLHNQSLVLACVSGLSIVFLLFLFTPLYMRALTTDDAVVQAGVEFIWWASPGFGLLFFVMTINATLRGLGLTVAPMAIGVLIIIGDAVFAFLLIPGHAFIPAFGLAGAGAASTLSIAVGLVVLWIYFHRTEPNVITSRSLQQPRRDVWRRIFDIGLPAGAELVLMFLSIAVIYAVIRDQGAQTQAGFGIGFRVLQTVLLPAVAIAFTAGPLTGQNFGAQNTARVREVFRTTATIVIVVTLVTSALVQWQTRVLLSPFDADAATLDTATLFLELMSWTFVAQGLVYTCGFMFQGLGNTRPALVSAATRFVVFSVPAVLLSQRADFRADQVWYLLTASVAVQALVSLWLLQVEFKRKLRPASHPLQTDVANASNPR